MVSYTIHPSFNLNVYFGNLEWDEASLFVMYSSNHAEKRAQCITILLFHPYWQLVEMIIESMMILPILFSSFFFHQIDDVN